MNRRAGSLLGLLRRDRLRWSWTMVVALLLAVLAPQPLPAIPDLFASAICAAGGEHEAPQEQHHGGKPDCCVIACQAAAPALAGGPEAMDLRLPAGVVTVPAARRGAAVLLRLGVRAASPRGPPAAA